MAEVVAERSAEAQRQIADFIALAAQLQSVAARLEGTPAAGPCGDDCPCVSEEPVDAPTLVPLGRTLPLADADTSGDGVGATPPIACSLEPDAMPGRIEDWQRVVASATGRMVLDDGVALQFPADPDIAGELARLAAAEQQCCTFFDFRINLAGPVMELEVRAPADAREIVTAMFGAAA